MEHLWQISFKLIGILVFFFFLFFFPPYFFINTNPELSAYNSTTSERMLKSE